MRRGRPSGASVGTAPQAIQPPRSRNVASGTGGALDAGVDRQRQHLRPCVEQDAPVGRPTAVQPGDRVRFERGERAGHQVDRRFRAEREPGAQAGDQPGLVDEHDERRTGCFPLREREQMCGALADRGCGHTANARSRARPRPAAPEPSVTGPVSCSLIGSVRSATARRNARSVWNGGPCKLGIGERRGRVERLLVDVESEPSGRTVTPRDAPAGLGEHALDRRADRDGGRGGQLRLLVQHEAHGLVSRSVRQAPDGCDEPEREVRRASSGAPTATGLVLDEPRPSVPLRGLARLPRTHWNSHRERSCRQISARARPAPVACSRDLAGPAVHRRALADRRVWPADRRRAVGP